MSPKNPRRQKRTDDEPPDETHTTSRGVQGSDAPIEHVTIEDAQLRADGSGVENPTELPEDHPLGSYNGVLDEHASHLEALGDYLRSAEPGEVQSLMLVLTTSEPATETIPSMHEDADFEGMVWHQLAAHLSHVAHAFNTSPEAAAKHAYHVLHDQQGPVDVYTNEDEDDRTDSGQTEEGGA